MSDTRYAYGKAMTRAKGPDPTLPKWRGPRAESGSDVAHLWIFKPKLIR